MFGASQISRFAAAVSAARFALFSCRLAYRGVSVIGASSSLKTGKKLEMPGFMYSHDAIVRIPLTAASPNAPTVGETLTIFMPGLPAAGQPVRISEVLTHATNPEYRLGVSAL